MTKLIAVLMCLFAVPASAKGFLGDMGVAGEIVDLGTSEYIQKVEGSLTPANKIQTGLKVVPTINVDSGINYELIGMYSGVGVNGFNTAPHRDAIGVQGTVFKNSADANAVGLKCSVYDALPGGTSTCLAIDYPYPQAGTPTAGITLLGSSWAEGLLGIEVINPQSYKHSINLNGSKMAVGGKSGSTYCLQFNEAALQIDYIKDCGTPAESVVGRVAITPIATYSKPSR